MAEDIRHITHTDISKLIEYIQAMDELSQREPEMFTDMENDTEPSEEWKQWDREQYQLNQEYDNFIFKALQIHLRDPKDRELTVVAEIIKALINQYDEVTTEDNAASTLSKIIPALKSVIPQKHVIPNHKLANSLGEILDEGACTLAVIDKGKPTEITSRCVITYDGDNVKLSSRQPYTEYDRSVGDAVCSLWVYGDSSHIITPAMVYRGMVHADESETPSPQQIGAVTRSLDKLRFVRVQVDCSEELKKRHVSLDGEQIIGGKIDTYLLNLKKMEVKTSGKTITAYKIMDTPVLYEYSSATKQVITVPSKLLDIRDTKGAKIANTEQRISIKSYLLRRVSVIKKDKSGKQSPHILLDDLIKHVTNNSESDTNSLSRKKRQSIKDYVLSVLDYWCKEHYIKGYELLKEGTKIRGFNIIAR